MKYKVLLIFLLVSFKFAYSNTLVAKVPFELFGEHIFFKLKIGNSKELDFIFDTGAGATIINSSTAKDIDFLPPEAIQVVGAGGIVDMQLYNAKPISINEKKIVMAELIGASLWKLERSVGKRIDGIIGKDLLDKFVVKVNYSNYQIEFYSFHAYRFEGNGKVLNMKFISGLPVVEIPLNIQNEGKKLQGSFLLDTGAGMALVFATPFAKNNEIVKIFPQYYISETTDITNINSRAYNSLFERVKLGDFEFVDLNVQAMDTRFGVYGWTEIAGMLGNEILKRFNITYNFQDSTSYWEKNQLYGELFNIDCSGINIEKDLEANEIIVTEVITDSPADEAGIRSYDRVKKVNGIPVSELTVPKIKRILRKEGEIVEVLIGRDKKEFKVSLSLAKLFHAW